MVLAAAAGLAYASSTMAVPVVIDLGLVVGNSAANAVSANGTTVTGQTGLVVGSSTVTRGFRWILPAGPMTATPAPVLDTFAHGRCINGDGTVIGGDTDGKPFRWSVSGGLQVYSLLPGGTYAWVQGMSSSGNEFCGTANGNASFTTRAVRWTSAGVPTVLAPLAALENSYGQGMSADGTIVVGGSTLGAGFRITKWIGAGAPINIGVLPGGDFAYANAISADNLVITGVSDTSPVSGGRFFRHTAAFGLQNLGKVSATSLGASAYAINGNGSCIVGVDTDSTNTNHAAIWTAATGVKRLDAYVVANGGSVAGWTFEYASGISANGTAICGTGFHNGNYRAFLIIGLPCIQPTIVWNPYDNPTVCVPGPGQSGPSTTARVGVATDGSPPMSVEWSVVLGAPGEPDGQPIALTGSTFADPVSGLTFDVAGIGTPNLDISNLRPGTVPRTIKFGGVVFNPCGNQIGPYIPVDIVTCTPTLPCNPADICGAGATYSQGGVDIGPDGALSIEDFVIFLSAFVDATGCPGGTAGGVACNAADLCGPGATYANGTVDIGPDGDLSVEDFVAFLSAFSDATGCP